MKNTKSTSTSTKNTKSTGKSTAKKTTGCSNTTKGASNKQESDSDPSGSYTGNPVGWGKYADPVQDADDL